MTTLRQASTSSAQGKPFPQPNQADVDRAARELYDPARLCQFCGKPVSLAQQLEGHCPHCQAILLAGPIGPERARVMLGTLKARRASLGLDAPNAMLAKLVE